MVLVTVIYSDQDKSLHQGFYSIMCSSRQNPYPTEGRSSENPRGRGLLKAKILEVKYMYKACMKLNWNFLRGGGKTKNLPLREYGYFLEPHNL